jgi:hypothetical protein
MSTTRFGWGARLLVAGLALAGLLAGRPAARAQTPAAKPAAAAGPVVVLRPTQREGLVAPVHTGSALTGGGAVTLAQPAPDTLVLNVTAAAAAKANPCQPSTASVDANVEQQFEVVFPAGVKPARLVLEARLSGLLRSEDCDCCLVSCVGGKCGKSGSAELVQAAASLHCGAESLATIAFPPKGVAGRDALAVNLAEGPVCVPVGPGCHTLHLTLRLSAEQPKALCPHIASAEFAPPPALPPNWIHTPDPFGGLDRTGLGFQVVVRVEPLPAETEPVPPPRPVPAATQLPPALEAPARPVGAPGAVLPRK